MNDPRNAADDQALARELAEASRAYRAADAATGEDLPAGPPAAMDEAIRAAARRAVQAGPRPAGKPWLLRFSKPLSVAAVLVLTASLVIVMKQEQPDFVPPAPGKAEKIAMPGEAAAPVALQEANAPAVPQGATPAPRADAPRPPAQAEKAAMASSAPDVSMPAEKKRAAATAERSADAGRTAATAAPRATGNVALAPPVYAPPAPAAFAPSPAPAPVATAPAAPPAYAALKESPAPAIEAAKIAERREIAPSVAVAKRDVATDNAAEATLRARAMAGAGAARDNADARPATPVAPAPARAVALAPAPPPASAASGRMMPMPQSTVDDLARALDQARLNELPETWLKRIITLRREQKTREADEEYARFRKRHPGYVIPAELKAAAGTD